MLSTNNVAVPMVGMFYSVKSLVVAVMLEISTQVELQ